MTREIENNLSSQRTKIKVEVGTLPRYMRPENCDKVS